MADNPNNNANQYVIFGGIGGLIGILIGIATRPTIMGVKIPLAVLQSTSPMDSPFKSELLSHLGVYLAVGVILGCVASYARITMAAAGAAHGSAPPLPQVNDDARKWQALVELDPEIAAQAKRVAAFGQPYLNELAQKYLAIGDKAYLAQIADAIVTRAETAAATRKAALQDRNNKFQGFRCFYDEQGRFVGEAKVESGEFHIFPSQDDFENAVRDYVTRGRPPIASRAIAPAAHVAAAK